MTLVSNLLRRSGFPSSAEPIEIHVPTSRDLFRLNTEGDCDTEPESRRPPRLLNMKDNYLQEYLG